MQPRKSQQEISHREDKWSRILSITAEMTDQERTKWLMKVTGASQGSVSKWGGLVNNVSDARSQMIAAAKGIEYNWLQTGKQPKVSPPLLEDEQEVLSLYRTIKAIEKGSDILGTMRIIAAAGKV